MRLRFYLYYWVTKSNQGASAFRKVGLVSVGTELTLLLTAEDATWALVGLWG